MKESQNSPSGDHQESIAISGVGWAEFEAIIKSIFSWFVLLPISIIISGKILSSHFPVRTAGDQVFRICVPKILNIEAKGSEVIIGFMVFICSIFFIALAGGENINELFEKKFGVGLGQWNSLVVFSGFFSVVLSTFVHLIRGIFIGKDKIADEAYSKLIRSLAEEDGEEG